MASENEPAKKLLLPYLQRADELQNHDPLVAYYCRLYAMERGLKIPQNERTKTTNAILISLMNKLEKDKKSLKLGPDDSWHLEEFALNVFAKADKQDRAGRADLDTAKTFYAASIFFEILNQFGPLQPDLEQKQKYAAWKAGDIRKAIKEGRKPTAGPPGGDEDMLSPSSAPNTSYDLGPQETSATASEPDPHPSPQIYDTVDSQHSADISPSPQFYNRTTSQGSTNVYQFHDEVNDQHPVNAHPSTSTSLGTGYPSQGFHMPPPANEPEISSFSQPYQHQPYLQEHQQNLPHGFPPQGTPSSYTYPHFQSYPSFSESSLPSVPSHYPSYYQGYDSSHSQPNPTANYSTLPRYEAGDRNGNVSEPAPSISQAYQYDSNYQPPAEKIAEAHKAARFAVGALAFDDVSVAVDYLKKSLELLTKPSAGQ